MMIAALILHSLAAMVLLGAITHQAAATWRRAGAGRSDALSTSFAAVRGPVYASTVVATYILTVLLGDVVYAPYRVDVKTMLLEVGLLRWNGIFEIKEHFVAIGLYLLLPYYALWKKPLDAAHALARRMVTTLLAFIVWYALITGHLLNNLKGVGL